MVLGATGGGGVLKKSSWVIAVLRATQHFLIPSVKAKALTTGSDDPALWLLCALSLCTLVWFWNVPRVLMPEDTAACERNVPLPLPLHACDCPPPLPLSFISLPCDWSPCPSVLYSCDCPPPLPLSFIPFPLWPTTLSSLRALVLRSSPWKHFKYCTVPIYIPDSSSPVLWFLFRAHRFIMSHKVSYLEAHCWLFLVRRGCLTSIPWCLCLPHTRRLRKHL